MSAVVALLAFGVAAALVRWLARPGSPLYVLDHPNERSLHDTPTPRTGGVGLLAGVLVGGAAAALVGHGVPAVVAGAALLVAGVAFVDDLRSLPPAARLVVQLGGAALLASGGVRLDLVAIAPDVAIRLPALVGSVLTVIGVVWMVNLYNFMDGMDGFAGGMAAIGFAGLALSARGDVDPAFTLLAWSVVGAAIGFLLFNFPPARIFMGDAGSSTLGLLAGAMIVWADLEGWVPLWVSILIFSPFIVDATVTLLRRLGRGERVWQAHRTHYYQRLVRLGWGHRRTVLAEYALMAAAAISAALAVRADSTEVQSAVALCWVACYVLLAWLVRRVERHASRESVRVTP